MKSASGDMDRLRNRFVSLHEIICDVSQLLNLNTLSCQPFQYI